MAEDLSTYTEVDSASDLTVTSSQITVDTMRRDADSYVAKDFGASYFGNFDVFFKIEVQAASGAYAMAGVALSNGARTIQDMQTAASGVMFFTNFDGTNYCFYIQNMPNSDQDSYNAGPSGRLNVRSVHFKRVGTTLTAYLYSGTNFSGLVDTLSLACESTAYSHFMAVASRDENTFNPGSNISLVLSDFYLGALPVSLHDVALDLTAYHEAREDLISFLRAHDGLELRDFMSVLEVYGSNSITDFKAFLKALQENFSSLPAMLQAAAQQLKNLAVVFEATDGTVFDDFRSWLRASDGVVQKDLGCVLRAVADIPVFRTIVAQKVSCVVHEVT